MDRKDLPGHWPLTRILTQCRNISFIFCTNIDLWIKSKSKLNDEKSGSAHINRRAAMDGVPGNSSPNPHT
jgi:hypothetical protein